MKELQVLAGEEVFKLFRGAWQVYWKLGCKEPVTFHHNECRVLILPDDSGEETKQLTWREAKAIVETKEKEDTA